MITKYKNKFLTKINNKNTIKDFSKRTIHYNIKNLKLKYFKTISN